MSKIITIEFSNKYIRKTEEVKNDLLWYDTVLQEMKVFKGGYLTFKYGLDQELVDRGYPHPYRLMPQVTSLSTPVLKQTNNKEDILKWFENFQNYENSDATIISEGDNSLDFEVPDNEVDDFLYECERNSFDYSI